MELGSLVVPVLASAVAVFVLSSIMWMVLPHHRNDYRKIGNEDAVLDHVRAQGAGPGMYMAPHCGHSKADRENPEIRAKLDRGPIVMLLVMAPGNMVKFLALWLVHLLLVSFVTAYVLRHALAPGAAFVEVLRIGTTAAFMTHVLGSVPNSIWGGRPWDHTLKSMADGLVYSLATGAIFAAFWPDA